MTDNMNRETGETGAALRDLFGLPFKLVAISLAIPAKLMRGALEPLFGWTDSNRPITREDPSHVDTVAQPKTPEEATRFPIPSKPSLRVVSRVDLGGLNPTRLVVLG